MQIPVGASEEFYGIIDLLTRKMATFSEGEKGALLRGTKFLKNIRTKTEELRSKIVEKAAELDDTSCREISK